MPDPIGCLDALLQKATREYESESEAYAAIKAGTFSVKDEDGNIFKVVIEGTKVWGDRNSGWKTPAEVIAEEKVAAEEVK